MTRNPVLVYTRACLLGLAGLIAHSLAAAPADITDEECATFGTQVAGYFSTGQQEQIVRQLDTFAFVERVTTNLGFDENEITEFRGGMLSQLGKTFTQQFKVFTSAHYLRAQSVNGEKRALVRCVNDAGAVNFFAFVVNRRASGTLKWIDVFVYLTGETMSETMNRAVLPLVANNKKNLLEKLTSQESEFVTNFPKITHATQLVQEGKLAEALAELDALPEGIQNQRYVLTMRLRAAQSVSNDAYLKVIKAWEKAYPDDPALDLVSFDGDLLRKDYPRALRRIDGLIERLGGDNYLTYLKGNVQLMAGDNAAARRTARTVLAAEPGILGAWDTLLTVSLNEKNYAETVTILGEFRHSHPKADMKSVIDVEPSYEGFRKSPEYRGWAASLEATK